MGGGSDDMDKDLLHFKGLFKGSFGIFKAYLVVFGLFLPKKKINHYHYNRPYNYHRYYHRHHLTIAIHVNFTVQSLSQSHCPYLNHRYYNCHHLT